MPPRAEKTPRTKEKSLTRPERLTLVSHVTKHALEQSKHYVLTTDWPRIEPYIELIAMTGILIGDKTIESRQQSHLRKMIAIQTTMVQQKSRALRTPEFLQAVNEEAGEEIAFLQTLPEGLEVVLPRVWANALDDVAQLQTDLSGSLE